MKKRKLCGALLSLMGVMERLPMLRVVLFINHSDGWAAVK